MIQVKGNLTIKRIMSILLTLAMTFTLLSGLTTPALAADAWDGVSIDFTWYTGGSDPYYIEDEADLAGLALIVNGTANGITQDSFTGKTVYLTEDLDLGGDPNNWAQIGDVKDDGGNYKGFRGTFDGNGHTVSNLYITATIQNVDAHLGLFGFIGPEGIVKNLSVLNATVTGSNWYTLAGGLAGSNAGTIVNCYATGTISATGNDGSVRAGGLLGANSGTVLNCYATANASVPNGSTYAAAGGLVGYNNNGLSGAMAYIYNCYATGSATGSNDAAFGGLVGENAVDNNNTPHGSITLGYWNDGGTNIAGIGDDGGVNSTITDVSGMSLDSMKEESFAVTLNENILTLSPELQSLIGDWHWKFSAGDTPILELQTGPGNENNGGDIVVFPPISNALISNGSLAFSPKTPGVNDVVTITPEPDEGYELDTLTARELTGDSLTVTDNGDGSYRFTYRGTPVVLTAIFKEKSNAPQENPFIDVHTEDWFFEHVLYIHEKGLLNGVSETRFAPDLPMNRGMLVTALWRLEGEPEGAAQEPFSDVKPGKYYHDAVAWAAGQGIVLGYGNGRYGPDDELTREQLAAILWRYAKYRNIDVSVGEGTNILSYGDASRISAYAVPAMQWACGEGIISGKPGNLLDPQGKAARAEAAAMLHRFIDAL